jgi:hypothetical protein
MHGKNKMIRITISWNSKFQPDCPPACRSSSSNSSNPSSFDDGDGGGGGGDRDELVPCGLDTQS